MRVYFCVLVLLFSETCSSADCAEFTSQEGQSLQVDCPYPPGNDGKRKYFCRVQDVDYKDCISTTVHNSWDTQGRFALFDNSSARFFSIIISKLETHDSGKYMCGVDIKFLKDFNSEVRIIVKSNLSTQQAVTGETHVDGVENSTSAFTRQKTTAPQQKEEESHFRFLAVVTMVCGVMLLFVCVFSLVLILRRNSSAQLSVSAFYHSRGKSNPELTEDDYVRMNPGIIQVSLPENEDRRSASCEGHPLFQSHLPGAEVVPTSPDLDPYYLQPYALGSPELHSEYMDPDHLRLSRVYQTLMVESVQEPIYQTLDIDSC
ncbi:CMRF35-like molecule 9 [Hoplias malabaricus]|uniref:CMRF35-like molecule 9 n=1 Tax=Hoplias malabaricus TaxID=27720 RepID=UPI0034631635